jgi:uncharacterized protein
MRHVQTSVPAPENLGTELIRVPPQTPVRLDLRLEAVMEGVLVSGAATAEVAGECARCLENFTDEVEVDLQELYYYPDRAVYADDDELPALLDDHLDLEPTLRDALVLDLPLSPLCDPDCAGLCVECGARLADVPPGHSHDVVDPRWASLASLSSLSADPSIVDSSNVDSPIVDSPIVDSSNADSSNADSPIADSPIVDRSSRTVAEPTDIKEKD